MSTNDSGLRDELVVELNPTGTPTPGPQAEPIPGRPADGADKMTWVDYVVALGADRTFVTGDTEHFDQREDTVTTAPALTKEQLVKLADRLGG